MLLVERQLKNINTKINLSLYDLHSLTKLKLTTFQLYNPDPGHQIEPNTKIYKKITTKLFQTKPEAQASIYQSMALRCHFMCAAN